MQVNVAHPNGVGAWVVKKFGGSSVSSSECWATIIAQAREGLDSNRKVLIVVSALTGVTDGGRTSPD